MTTQTAQSAVRPVTRELSACSAAAGGASTYYQTISMADWPWLSRPGGMLGLFQEMEDRDAHLFATLQTRKNALLACPWKVVAADDSEPAVRTADTVREVLAKVAGFSTAIFHLLDALAKGFAVAEIIWTIDDATGQVGIEDIRARVQAEFAFDAEGKLYLLETRFPGAGQSPASASALLPRLGEAILPAANARQMPARKFLHFAPQGNACSPYGAPLALKAYTYYWLKKCTLQHWALFNEKFGSPTAVARYSAAMTEEDLQKLEDTVASLPRDTGVLLPEGVALEFLEARRSSGANTYRELADWCNDEISKIILGQTLTTSEGRRSGSLALGQIHEAVRRDYLASDAAALGQALTSQLARWIVDFNFGVHAPAPTITFDVNPPEQMAAELAIDRELVKMGVAIPTAYFYERYRRPAPRAHERTLRYDDANLYQYHLLHGILTVNEVRETLGLPPVPWGHHPTGQAAPGGTDHKLSDHLPGTADTPGGEDEAELDERKADRRSR